jgi:hypothetical protein
VTPPVGPWPAVPYIIANVCWKVDTYGDDDLNTHKYYLGATEDYNKVLTVDDPDRYDEFLMSNSGFTLRSYPGLERRYTLNDKKWHYLEKFDTFWLREWVADCTVTRAVLKELEVFQKTGKLESVYRSVDSHIIYQHLDTLQKYWD